MDARKTIVAGGSLLLGGAVATQASTLASSVILARLIGPEQFGIASALMISVTLLGMITDMGSDKLLIQSPDGDAPSLQNTIHLFQVVRGAGSSAILLLLAWPMATLFHIPQAKWAFYAIALVPLIRGFGHLDNSRQQRHMKFGPSVCIDLFSQITFLIVAAMAAWWWRDYRAVMFGVLAQALVAVILSFALAERQYRWTWDRAHSAKLLHFGWPLLINGILLFAIFQGDRIIVGNRFGVIALAWYTIAYNLTSMATSLFARVGTSLLLPLLAKVQNSPDKFVERNRLTARSLVCLGR